MTDKTRFNVFDSDLVSKQLSAEKNNDANKLRYSVDETYWGYIIRSTDGAPIATVATQVVAGFLGLIFLLAAVGITLFPSAVAGDAWIMRLGIGAFFLGDSSLCFWYSCRGSQVELQVDTRRGEVREVVRNRAGRSTLLAHYGFDAIGGVHLERDKSQNGEARLVMRYRNSAQTVPVAPGQETALVSLRDRLGRDLLTASDGMERRKLRVTRSASPLTA